MGQDVIAHKAAKPHIDEDISCDYPHHRSHHFLWAHLEVGLNYYVAYETTEVPVIFGIPVTKRRVSPKEKSTPQGPRRQCGGGLLHRKQSFVIHCSSHKKWWLPSSCSPPASGGIQWGTHLLGSAGESMQTSGFTGLTLLHIKNDVSFSTETLKNMENKQRVTRGMVGEGMA